MPITPFQREVFAVLKHGRSAQSFVFGATILNSSDDTPRFSRDIDICHDAPTAVALAAAADEAALVQAGMLVSWQLRQPTFQRAVIHRAEDAVKLEWVYDSAFRFYPLEEDSDFGWRLHFADAATNKLLALAGRSEARDFVDAVHLHEHYLSLGALAWAAAGKDEGLTPSLILEMARRFAKYRQSDIDALHLAKPLELTKLKETWQAGIEEGLALVKSLPANEIGCLYLDRTTFQPTIPEPTGANFETLFRHYGSVYGAWPVIARD